MDTLAQDTHASASSSTPNIAVTSSHKLLAACPCLNVKLHLATEPDQTISLAGKELKLGLAGVSVEQKILCSLSISKDVATVHCLNCDQDVYTFQPGSISVHLEPTSLTFLASSVLFSPSDGLVVASKAVLTGQDIDTLVNDANYSKAFRLILTPTGTSSARSPATAISSADQPPSSSTQLVPLSTPQDAPLYRPHLERVRSILDKELEANLSAQQQRTEARIEAYKSQQRMALKESIENTRREKERLWSKIQERVTSLPPLTAPGIGELYSAGGAQALSSDGSLDVNGSQHPFDIPGTLPIRLTSASRMDGPHSAFLDRRKASVSDVAMSVQFREFDQRMASNSLRRQSIVPVTTSEPTLENVNLTLINTAANAAPSAAVEQPASSTANSETSSPTSKSKKKVTINDSVKKVSIVEPEEASDYDYNGQDDEDDKEEGVVFDLDEELGFGDEEPQSEDNGEDEGGDQELDDIGSENDPVSTSNGNGVAISQSSRSSLSKSGMVVGSLRANYLRRQRGLQQHRRTLDDDDLDSDEGEGGAGVDDTDGLVTASNAAFLGTSLPIQIQGRRATVPPPAPTRTSTLATSLAMPPGSTPAAAMLQRRLSRAYGPDNVPENGSTSINYVGSARPLNAAYPGSYLDSTTSASYVPSSFTTVPGSVMIDPLMLLEEEHDNDDQQDRLRKHRQPFSAINHRRDLEKSLQGHQGAHGQDHSQEFTLKNETAGSTDGSVKFSSSASQYQHQQQADFEPPHLYSARTYVGETPWEMPTRITVKSGGMQREGTHLDKEIALEMAKELEKERQEKEALSVALLDNREEVLPVSISQPCAVDKIEKTGKEQEEEEEEEEEDEETRRRQHSLPAARAETTS
ncbi:hypothetical protein EDD11_001756 [Mortierella claussenii]|nr:hypothetical protein EDD11_001756 [Mortierella claussenii]